MSDSTPTPTTPSTSPAASPSASRRLLPRRRPRPPRPVGACPGGAAGLVPRPGRRHPAAHPGAVPREPDRGCGCRAAGPPAGVDARGASPAVAAAGDLQRAHRRLASGTGRGVPVRPDGPKLVQTLAHQPGDRRSIMVTSITVGGSSLTFTEKGYAPTDALCCRSLRFTQDLHLAAGRGRALHRWPAGRRAAALHRRPADGDRLTAEQPERRRPRRAADLRQQRQGALHAHRLPGRRARRLGRPAAGRRGPDAGRLLRWADLGDRPPGGALRRPRIGRDRMGRASPAARRATPRRSC